MSLFQGINVVSITVTDLDKGRAFYRDVLGFGEPVYDLPEMGWIEFKTGSTAGNISLVPPEGEWQPSNSTSIVLNTPDCTAAVQALRAKGVRCDDPVNVPGMVNYFSFYDPFGNRLQGCSEPLPAE
ncbi:MAG: VOC family protein [Anaerolineae bacterium]|nr:VOC family protein [Anaerolineae bacterium]